MINFEIKRDVYLNYKSVVHSRQVFNRYFANFVDKKLRLPTL